MSDVVFNKFFEKLMECEGCYFNDANDNGGETKYGVSKNSYPELDIPNLTKEDAKQILKKDYWNPCKCDDMPPAIACYVADMAYHSGCRQSAKILQRSACVCDDGIIGTQTLRAIHSKRQKDLLFSLQENRLAFLQKLDSWKHYGNGWTNRCNDVFDFCKEMI